MTLKYIWRSFQPWLSFPRLFQQSFACFRVARSPSNSWASCWKPTLIAITWLNLTYTTRTRVIKWFLAHSKNELMQWRGVRRLSVCPSVLRKSLLLADNCPDWYQTCTRWSTGKPAFRVFSRSRSRSKVTWYAYFFGFLEWATPSFTVWLLFYIDGLYNCW